MAGMWKPPRDRVTSLVLGSGLLLLNAWTLPRALHHHDAFLFVFGGVGLLLALQSLWDFLRRHGEPLRAPRRTDS
jgi:hypothetical protein